MIPVAVLAGGKGTRIASIAGPLPKALVPVAGSPFLDHQLRWLRDAGAREVVLCIGYRARTIREYVGTGDRWNLHVSYSEDGESLRGTGGAVRNALAGLGDTFLTVYGDVLFQCDPAAAASALTAGDDGVMAVFENRDRWMPSNVRVRDGHVVAYQKDAPPGTMTHMDYGINVFRARSFDAFSGRDAFDLSEVHLAAIERGALRAFSCDRRWYDIGSPDALAEAERFVRGRDPSAALPGRGRAVFLDRDGVINRAIVRDGKPYPPQNLAEIELEPEAAHSVALLRAAGFVTICVTNQPDVPRGTLPRAQADAINSAIVRAVGLDDLIACFHDDGDRCACRKPLPGMLLDGARRHGVELASSYMVGDRWRDIDAGRAAGCRTILVERHWAERDADGIPDGRVASIGEAVSWIVSDLAQDGAQTSPEQRSQR